jgi:phage tail protein X
MPATYTTKQDEMVDAICHRYYGGSSGTTEAVLAANPGLADLSPILPLGTMITLPDIQTRTQQTKLVSLWD